MHDLNSFEDVVSLSIHIKGTGRDRCPRSRQEAPSLAVAQEPDNYFDNLPPTSARTRLHLKSFNRITLSTVQLGYQKSLVFVDQIKLVSFYLECIKLIKSPVSKCDCTKIIGAQIHIPLLKRYRMSQRTFRADLVGSDHNKEEARSYPSFALGRRAGK